ncbi:AAA family ATPase, partial [Priestia megaterium]
MNSSSGIGDPYFYEWTVGLDRITSMLIPEEGIESVTLQASIDTLDDVVCEHIEKNEYIQVKHTRVNEKIGFAFLLSSSKNSDSLLMKIAKSWRDLKDKDKKECYATLLTNREPVASVSSINRGDKKVEFPEFNKFLKWFRQKGASIQSLDDLKSNIPREEENKECWSSAIDAWLEEIDVFEEEERKIEFIQKFRIVIEHPNTAELDEKILTKLVNIFSISQETSLELYKSLFYSLKNWASSTRTQEKITVEEVYSSLAIKEEKYPQHLLFPPTPFFESRKNLIADIEKRSESQVQKVLFLYGKPGIGKTSLVNFLANKPGSIVDLRYHAYVPVTPDSPYVNLDFDKSITEEMMWGSLLNQLRELFRGKLYEYRVPIRNQFLSKEALRKTVLRLASEYGKIHKKNTVIVIDGIDHAARSGSKESFLKSLISPEQVPDNVYFIICGQPAEDYENYPIWLDPCSKTESLDKIEITNITLDDIKVLMTKVNPLIDDINSAARIIFEISQGNTLSATFAAYESRNIKDSSELVAFLNKKNLSSNITEYYNSIWNSLDNKALKNGYKIKDLLATLFSITIEKVSIEDISNIFKDNGINRLDWEKILGLYSPLVIEDKGKYSLYHNDIRVYLKNKLRRNSNIVSYVSGEIANYYLNSSEKMEVKHRDILRLLNLSGRSSEKIEVFSLEYVKEAIMIRQDRESLLQQFKEIVQQSEIEYNFKQIEEIALISIYLNQYVRIIDHYENVHPPTEIPKLLHSEYKKINLNVINITDIRNVVNDITNLIDKNQKYRARALFDRWFANCQLLLSYLIKNENWTKKERLAPYSLNTLIEIGYLSIILNRDIYIGSLTEEHKITKMISYGQLKGMAENGTPLEFAKLFKKNAPNINSWELEELLDILYINQEWIKLLYILSKVKKRSEWLFHSLDMKFLFLSTALEIKQSTDPFYDDIKLKGFKALNDEEYDYSIKLSMYCANSFILGYLGKYKSKKLEINEGVEGYYKDSSDDRGKAYLQKLLNISFDLGVMFKDRKQLNFLELKNHLDYFFDKCRTPFLDGIYEVANQISKFIIYLIESSNDSDLELQLTDYFLDRTKKENYSVNYSVTLTWDYLASRGYYTHLAKWFTYWLGVNGRVWESSIDDIISTYSLFSELMLKYKVSEKMVNEARESLYKNLLGFIEHKDTALKYPYNTFKTLAELDPSSWNTKGLELYNLSLLANNKGDNLLSLSIEELFLDSAILSGPQEFQKLLNNISLKEKIVQSADHISWFFRNNWEKLNFSETDLLALWCLIEALSNKTSESDNELKVEFINEIKDKLSYTNFKFLESRTKGLKREELEKLNKRDTQKDENKYHELPIDKLISEFLNEAKDS